MKRLATILALVAVTALAAQAGAATITFSGNPGDFTSQGIGPIAIDGFDTEYAALNIDRVFITNDATNLYIGFDYDRSGWCDINLQLAFNTRPGGSGIDPFCRQIDWTTAPNQPDYLVYDVIPTQCNPYDYEVLFETNGSGGWNTLQDGANGLNAFDPDGGQFYEIAIPLARLGLGCAPGNTSLLQFEIAVTQEGCSKPGFDFIVNDGEQRSTPAGTCFDTPACPPSKPTQYLTYQLECPVPAEGRSWGAVKSLYR